MPAQADFGWPAIMEIATREVFEIMVGSTVLPRRDQNSNSLAEFTVTVGLSGAMGGQPQEEKVPGVSFRRSSGGLVAMQKSPMGTLPGANVLALFGRQSRKEKGPAPAGPGTTNKPT